MLREWTSSSSAPPARTSTLGGLTLGLVLGGGAALAVVAVWQFTQWLHREGSSADEERPGQDGEEEPMDPQNGNDPS